MNIHPLSLLLHVSLYGVAIFAALAMNTGGFGA